MVGRGTSLAEVRRVGRRGLSCAGTAQHALEDSQTLIVRDNLFQSDGGDVQTWTACRHVGIALVGAYHDVSCLGNAEVGTRHTGVSGQKFVAQTQACTVGQVRRVVVALLVRDAFLLEQLAHVVMVQVDGGHHDVRGLLALELDDAFAEVGLHYFDAFALQIRVHLALFGEHRLRLHHFLHVVVLQDAVDNLVELLRILGPVYLYTVLLGIRSKLVQILIQMRDSVTLDGTGLLA